MAYRIRYGKGLRRRHAGTLQLLEGAVVLAAAVFLIQGAEYTVQAAAARDWYETLARLCARIIYGTA